MWTGTTAGSETKVFDKRAARAQFGSLLCLVQKPGSALCSGLQLAYDARRRSANRNFPMDDSISLSLDQKVATA
jgi:hypothetical protein